MSIYRGDPGLVDTNAHLMVLTNKNCGGNFWDVGPRDFKGISTDLRILAESKQDNRPLCSNCLFFLKTKTGTQASRNAIEQISSYSFQDDFTGSERTAAMFKDHEALEKVQKAFKADLEQYVKETHPTIGGRYPDMGGLTDEKLLKKFKDLMHLT